MGNCVDLQLIVYTLSRVNGALTNWNVGDSVTDIENLPRPRHIKTHLTVMLLPVQLWTVKPKVNQRLSVIRERF